MTTSITKLLCDAVEALGPADPSIMRLEQDSPQMGDTILLLLTCQDSLIVVAASRLDLAVGALEEVLDVVWGHVEG